MNCAFEIGRTASVSKTISETDVYLFAGITGDFNPAHVNEVYARDTIFNGRIAHGMISAGLISAVLGAHMPGPGTIYLSQTLKFLAPVRIGDTITATVTITNIIAEKNRATILTEVRNQDEKTVTTGEAVVMLPKK